MCKAWGQEGGRGLTAGTYGCGRGQRSGGRAEWVSVFLTLQSGGADVLDILDILERADLALKKVRTKRPPHPGPLTGGFGRWPARARLLSSFPAHIFLHIPPLSFWVWLLCLIRLIGLLTGGGARSCFPSPRWPSDGKARKVDFRWLTCCYGDDWTAQQHDVTETPGHASRSDTCKNTQMSN